MPKWRYLAKAESLHPIFLKDGHLHVSGLDLAAGSGEYRRLVVASSAE